MNTLSVLQTIDKNYSQYSAVADFKNECKRIMLTMVELPQTVEEYNEDIEMLKNAYAITGDADFHTKQLKMDSEFDSFKIVVPAMESIKLAYDDKKYKKAFKKSKNELKKNPDNRFLKACIDNYKIKYVISVLKKADKQIDKRNLNEADKIVSTAISNYKCNEFIELKDIIYDMRSPAYKIKKNVADHIAKSRAGIKKEIYAVHNYIGNKDSYIIKSGKKMILGDYSEDKVTILSVIGRGALAIPGIDIPMDLVDLSYDIVHWGEDDYFAFRIASDVIAILPFYGAANYFKYAKTAKAMKNLKKLGKTKYAIKTFDRIKKLANTKWANSNIAARITKIHNSHYPKIKTINQKYKGEFFPGTNIKMVEKKLKYSNGDKCRGNFFQFPYKTKILLPKSMQYSSVNVHKNYFIKVLKKTSKKKLSKIFNANEIKVIKNGKMPKNYTVHHSENERELQLVLKKDHEKVRHTGGIYTWGHKRLKREML